MKRKLCWYNVILVLVILAIFAGALILSNIRKVHYQSVSVYVTSDVVYADGATAHFDSKNFGRMDKDDVATLHLQLPEQPIFERSTLVFYDYNAVTHVWFGDELLASYGEDIAAKGRMIGNRYFQVPLPDEAWGGEITITVQATENNAFSNFTQLRVFPTEYAHRYFTDVDLYGVLCSLVLFVIGLLGLLSCLLGRLRGSVLVNALCLISTMMLVSFWLTANEGIYLLFGIDGYFWQPLEYMAGYSIAIPMLLFYRNMASEKSKWHSIFGWAVVVVACFFAIATILNFTNLLHYNSLMGPGGALLAISCLLMLTYTICQPGDNSEIQTILRTGTYLFLPVCLYETLLRSLFVILPVAATFRYPPLMALGVLIFLLCQVCAFISDLYRRQRNLLSMQIRSSTLDRIFSKTPAGICQFMPDENMTIISANDIFYQIVGLKREKHTKENLRNLAAMLSEQERESIRQNVSEIQNGTQNTAEYELSKVDENGQHLTFSVRYYYDREGDGSISANVVDISERKSMEQELKLLEQEYQAAARLSGRKVVVYDIKTRTIKPLHGKKCVFEKFDTSKDIQETLRKMDIFNETSWKYCNAFFDDIRSGKKTGSAYLRLHIRDKQDFQWYCVEFSNIFDKGGNPVRAVISLFDATEQHEAELAYKRMQLSSAELPDAMYKSYEYNLTQDVVEGDAGAAFTSSESFLSGCRWMEIKSLMNSHVCPEYIDAFMGFISRDRLLSAYKRGLTADKMELQVISASGEKVWFEATIQMVEDPFNGDVKAYYRFKNIDEEKKREVKEKMDMEKMRKELENSRIKVMINQMQPHFLYNALSSIQMITKYDPQRAYDLIHDFTVHLRGSIKALSSDKPIPFAEELKNVRAYLNIEMMRFEGNLFVNYDIRCDNFNVIPLTIQPLVENAVKHGVFPKGEEGGTVTVRSYEEADAYTVEIEDDGSGFDVDKALVEGNNSYGLKNLVFRLSSLMGASVEFDSVIGRGTKVTVSFPKG